MDYESYYNQCEGDAEFYHLHRSAHSRSPVAEKGG